MDRNIDERRGQVEKAGTEAKTVLATELSDLSCEENGIDNLKSRSSSAESIYDLIEEESVNLSDNEVGNDQKVSVNNSCFDISENAINGEVSTGNSSENLEEFEEVECDKEEDNIDCNSMDEEFVIVDDASEVQEEKKADSPPEKNASDRFLEIDEIIDEFAEEENKDSKVLKVDPEDELDSIFEEFVESEKKVTVSSTSSELPTVVSAEGDKEIETLLDAFKDQNDSDDDCLIIEDGNASDSKQFSEASSGDSNKTIQKPNELIDGSENTVLKNENPVSVLKNSSSDLLSSDVTNTIPNQNEVNSYIKIDQTTSSEICKINQKICEERVEENKSTSREDNSQSYNDLNSKALSEAVAVKASEAGKVLEAVISKCVSSAENLFSDEIVDANKFDNTVSCRKRKASLTCENVKGECEDDESALSNIVHYLVKQTVATCDSTNETCCIEDDTEIVNRAPDISISQLLTSDSMSGEEETAKSSDLDNNINNEIDVSGDVSEMPSSEEIKQNSSIKPCSVVINMSCEESDLQISLNSSEKKASESNSKAFSDDMMVANSNLNLGISVCSKSNTEDDEDVSDLQSKSPVVSEVTHSLESEKKGTQNDKKRKFDVTDFSDSGSQTKKVKDNDTETDLSGANILNESKEMLDDESKSEESKSEFSEKIVEEAHSMAEELKEEIRNSPIDVNCIHQTSKRWLNNFAAFLVMNYVENFSAEISVFEKKNQAYLEQLRSFDSFEEIKKTLSDFMNTQQAAFLKHNFKNKLLTRTVGVNVKIYKNSSLPNSRYAAGGTNAVNSELSQRNNITITPVNQLNKPVLSLPMQQQFARRMPVSPVLNQVRRPGPPNVTTSLTSEMVPVFRSPGNKLVTNPQSMVVFSNPMGTPPRGQLDLTAEEIANRKTAVTTQSYVPGSSSGVAKVLTGVNSNQNVLVPFSNLLLQRPVIPQLPPNMIGARTLTYIVPPNSGPLSSIGGRAIPPFISSSGQRVQLVVRVTNPNSLPPASTVVNSLAKIASTSSQASTSSSNSQPSPGLVLISRTSKHPAPFPAAPTYQPNNKLKALPPKPSLKGSKAPNGIILSWNMSVFSSHADIATYQLFAYQESNGPVSSNLWKKVGDVKALPLPMACTLTQFQEGHRYYFTVRAVDTYSRFGPFSDAVTILFADGDPPVNH
ncbi:uncharacterized protein LOC129219313 [Uloborus diversus]|uniref:uncharacterized protein LOC129219313 n=1 Tax=Uloborus diversus TaxID=327109 RepID=UPI0024094F72|nr:uncharacterized protein LOC129219313 [Uloborus diversus]